MIAISVAESPSSGIGGGGGLGIRRLTGLGVNCFYVYL